SADEKCRLHKVQQDYFNQGRMGFSQLPAAEQRDTDLRNLLVLGFEVMALGIEKQGDKQRALKLCDEAISIFPNSPKPWTVRGIVKLPDSNAIEDFKKAANLGDDDYFPYYYLAGDSLAKNDYESVLAWSEQALNQPSRPRPEIESQLQSWIAISRDCLGASPNE